MAVEKKKITYKFPTTTGAAIDRLYELRGQRQGLQKQADAVGAEESALRQHLIDTCQKSELNGARGTLATCTLVPKTVATVKDWHALYKYIKKHDAWDLLERRPSHAAYVARLEAKQKVPGVEPFHVTGLAVHKISGGKKKK
jgi:hypothetical protein